MDSTYGSWPVRAPPRVVSDQLQLAVESIFGYGDEWFASAEAYARTFDGVVTENLVESPSDPLDDLVAGTGLSYGLDLFLRRDRGELTGWISASFLKTDRTFPDTQAGIEPFPDITYPPRLRPPFRSRHRASAVTRMVGCRRRPALQLRDRTPLYTPEGLVQLLCAPPARTAAWSMTSSLRFCSAPATGSGIRPRHRLDLSFRKPLEKRWGKLTPYLNIINVYNQRNVLFYFFEYGSSPPGSHWPVDDSHHADARNGGFFLMNCILLPRGFGRTAAMAVPATLLTLGCELTERSIVEIEEVVLVESQVVLTLDSRGSNIAGMHVSAFLHLTEGGAGDLGDMTVQVTGSSGRDDPAGRRPRARLPCLQLLRQRC